jgi:hypothetical protein
MCWDGKENEQETRTMMKMSGKKIGNEEEKWKIFSMMKNRRVVFQ